MAKENTTTRRTPTKYPCIYKQTGKNLFDVRYNYKVIRADTGKTEYKSKWVYGITSLALAKRALLQLQSTGVEDEKITLEDAFNLWLKKAKIEQYSEHSIKNTTCHINMIYSVVPRDLKLEQIDYSVYERFIEGCRESGYSQMMIVDLNKTFRKLILLAYKEGKLTENPLIGFDDTQPTARDRTVIVLPSEFQMMDNMLSEVGFIRKGIDPNIKRRLLLNFLYYTGMTIGEVLSIRYRDFVPENDVPDYADSLFDGMLVKVNGATATGFIVGVDGAKKSKIRYVPLYKPLEELVLKCKSLDADNGGSIDDLVFSFTHSNASELLKHLTKKLQINKKIVCQSFRDTFIAKMIKNGITLPQLCYTLGETQDTILRRYKYLFSNNPENIIAVFEAEKIIKK